MSPQVHWSQQSDSKDKSTNPLTRLGDRPIRPKPGLLTDFIQIKKYETGLVKKPRPKNLDLLDIKNDLTFDMHNHKVLIINILSLNFIFSNKFTKILFVKY